MNLRIAGSRSMGKTRTPPTKVNKIKNDELGTYVVPGVPSPLTISLTVPSQGISPPPTPMSQEPRIGPTVPDALWTPEEPFTA